MNHLEIWSGFAVALDLRRLPTRMPRDREEHPCIFAMTDGTASAGRGSRLHCRRPCKGRRSCKGAAGAIHPSSARGLRVFPEKLRYSRPDFIPVAQQEVSPGRELDEPGVGDRPDSVLSDGKCPVEVIRCADEKRGSGYIFQRVLDLGPLRIPFV